MGEPRSMRLKTMEGQQIEYKKGFGKELIISLVAFSNTDGGKVVITKEYTTVTIR